MDQYRMINGNDFADFVSGFIYFIRKIFNYVVTAVKEYFKTAILIFIFTIAAGLFYWHYSKIFYEAVMVCSFTEMNKKTYGEMVHNLGLLAKSHSFNVLALQLNIPLDDA